MPLTCGCLRTLCVAGVTATQRENLSHCDCCRSLEQTLVDHQSSTERSVQWQPWWARQVANQALREWSNAVSLSCESGLVVCHKSKVVFSACAKGFYLRVLCPSQGSSQEVNMFICCARMNVVNGLESSSSLRLSYVAKLVICLCWTGNHRFCAFGDRFLEETHSLSEGVPAPAPHASFRHS